MASQNGHVEVVNILLQNGAHVDVQKKVSLISPTNDRAVKLYTYNKNMTRKSLLDLSPYCHICRFRTSGLL